MFYYSFFIYLFFLQSDYNKQTLLSSSDERWKTFDTLTHQLHEANLYFKLSNIVFVFFCFFFDFQAIVHFVNQNMATLGLQVADVDKQVKVSNKWTLIGSSDRCSCQRKNTTSWLLPLWLCHLPWTGLWSPLCVCRLVCWWCDSAAADWTAGRLLHPTPWLQPDPSQSLWDGTVWIQYGFLIH